MRFQSLHLFSLVGTASAAVSSSNTDDVTEPCGEISSFVLDFYASDTNTGLNLNIAPSIANACLLSSGIDKDLAIDFIVELKKYLEFQTTLAYLKDPPSDYPYPATDILGGLDSLASKVADGSIASQYVLDQALNQLLVSAHEGHLYSSFCSLQPIIYTRQFDVASVSPDGIQLPALYVYDDLFLPNTTAISSIVTINGQNANEFIEKEALTQTADPDAAYNSIMASPGRQLSAGSSEGSFRGFRFYPGDYTNLTFSNGTTLQSQNTAVIRPGVWDPTIANGDDFTNTFCIIPALPPSSTTGPASTSTETATMISSPTATATPTIMNILPYTPIVGDPNNQIAGYFLNGSDYADTAVLWVGTFAQENSAFANADTIATSFQNTTRDFLAALRAAPERNKLIIDLSGNPGGNTLLPDDVFKRLFPSIEPYGGARFRVPVAGDIWGQTLAAITPEMINPNGSTNLNPAQIGYFTTFYNYRYILSTNLKNFMGWGGDSGLFPPNVQKGDNFTANYRLPLNNTLFDEAIDGIDVAGYPGIYSKEDSQPFPAENIVILTDGWCASACSIFTELMTRQVGIKTIAVGGRSRNAPMQAIGGTKGSLALNFEGISEISQTVWGASAYIPPSLLELANETFPGLKPLPLGRRNNLASFSINGADNIPVGDDLQVPLQFVFEPANCRIFYTPKTVLNENSLWTMVADIAWKGHKCAWGGMDTNVANSGTGVGNSTTPGQDPAKKNAAGVNTVMGSVLFCLAGAVAMILV